MTRPLPRRPHLAVVLAALLITLAGCGSNSPKVPAGTPVLTVVTGVYPLAQAVEAIGQSRVAVVNLTTPGTDPADLTLTAQQVAQVHSANLVLEVGGGYQPALAQAAAGNPHVVSVLSSVGGTDQYFWLDPATLQRVGTIIAAALTKAQPVAKTVFANGQADFADEMQSVSIDFQETLSDCSTPAVVTPDDAFSRTAKAYGFTDVVVSKGESVADASAAAKRAGAMTAFTEPWVDNPTLAETATAAHLKVKSLDTLAGPPPGGWPPGANLFALLEQDLGTIKDALQCASMGSV